MITTTPLITNVMSPPGRRSWDELLRCALSDVKMIFRSRYQGFLSLTRQRLFDLTLTRPKVWPHKLDTIHTQIGQVDIAAASMP